MAKRSICSDINVRLLILVPVIMNPNYLCSPIKRWNYRKLYKRSEQNSHYFTCHWLYSSVIDNDSYQIRNSLFILILWRIPKTEHWSFSENALDAATNIWAVSPLRNDVVKIVNRIGGHDIPKVHGSVPGWSHIRNWRRARFPRYIYSQMHVQRIEVKDWNWKIYSSKKVIDSVMGFYDIVINCQANCCHRILYVWSVTI